MTTTTPIGEICGGLIKTALREGNCPKHGPWSAEVRIDSKTGQVLGTDVTECPKCAHERWEAEAPLRAEQARRIEEKVRAEAERIEAEERQAKLEKLLRSSAIPLEYEGKGFTDFVVSDPKTAETVRQAKLYAENFERIRETGTGLFFYGTTGTGKTHLACAVLQALARQGVDVVYAMTWQIIQAVKKASFGEDALDPFIRASILVLDEVGVQTGSRFEESVLYPLIDSRVAQRRPTIFISNVQPDAKDPSYQGETVRKLIGERLWDRVQHRSVFLKLAGPSHRKRFASVDELIDSITKGGNEK